MVVANKPSSNDGVVGNSLSGLIIGVILLAAAILPQLYWLFIGYENVTRLETAFWGFGMSAILVASYFFPTRSFLFRWLIWAFENIHLPPLGRPLALVYAGLFALISVVTLMRSP